VRFLVRCHAPVHKGGRGSGASDLGTCMRVHQASVQSGRRERV
jgi:hypothetical protein